MDVLAQDAVVGKSLMLSGALDHQGLDDFIPTLSVCSASDLPTATIFLEGTFRDTNLDIVRRNPFLLTEAALRDVGILCTGVTFAFFQPDDDSEEAMAKISLGGFSGLTTTLDNRPEGEPLLCDGFMQTLLARGAFLSPDIYESIEDRLLTIIDPEELKDEGITPSMTSFYDFIDFLVTQKGLAPPSLTISRQGHFVASWRLAIDKLVSLEFLGGNQIAWLIFTPEENAAGELTSKRIMRRIRSFQAAEWMRHG